MADNTTKYLLYASLLLGSIGTYHAVKDGMTPVLDSQAAVAGLLTNGNASSADFTNLLTQLSKRVDENAYAKAANADTIQAVADDTTDIRSDVDELTGSITAVDTFLQSFKNKSTDVHNKLADIEATLSTLTAFNSPQASSPVEVDSVYVSNLSKRIDLIQTSINSSSKTASTARDNAEANKGSLAKIKASVDTLTAEFSAAKIASGQVAQLKEQMQTVSPASASIAAITTRLNGLTSESQGLAERLAGLEKWKKAKVDIVNNVSSGSTSGEISASIEARLIDVEILADGNHTNMNTLRTNVDLNTDDISTNEVDLQEQISENKSAISAVELKADTTDDNLLNIWTPKVAGIEADITALEGKEITANTKIAALEQADSYASAAREIITDDLEGVATRVTDAESAIDALESDVELVVMEGINANKASIVAMVADAAYLSEKLLRSGDDVVCNGLLRAEDDVVCNGLLRVEDDVVCNGLLTANAGAEISLDGKFLRMAKSDNDNFMMYLGDGQSAKGPSGAAPAKGHGFSGNAARMRVQNISSKGFIVENTSEHTLMSVRGNDGYTFCKGRLDADEYASLYADTTTAYFSQKDHANTANFALSHDILGVTTLNSNGSSANAKVQCRVRGNDTLIVTSDKVNINDKLVVANGGSAYATVLSAIDNTICTGNGRKTFFKFGKRHASVEIRDKEVRINGTDVLAKLNSLQAQLNKCVKSGSKVIIRNHKANKYLDEHGKPSIKPKDKGQRDAHYDITLD